MRRSDDSRLADNLLLFCRTLRGAGIPAGPGAVLEAVRAVLGVGLERRDDVRHALRAVLVHDPAQFRLFDQAFHLYFRNPRLLERMMALLLPTLEQEPEQRDSALRRLAEALAPSAGRDAGDDGVDIDIDRAGSYSADEVLRHKDFEQMTLAEQREARELLKRDLAALAPIATRRFRTHPAGDRYDLRRSMRLMIRNDGQPVSLARKRRLKRPPTLVVLCDISGSMSGYSRMFLHFAHALTQSDRVVHSFVFGTRLTNITRRISGRDVDAALAEVASRVRDWDGGTRIAGSLRQFNIDWGRRVLTGNALVLLLSDGLERDAEADLEFQAARLRRSCRRLIWLNPMLRYDAFEPRASGIRRMLPHVDLFLPAHNVASLGRLAELLAREARFPPARRCGT